MRTRTDIFFLVSLLFVLGCSSAPERPLEIDNIRSMAEAQLDLANRDIDHGNYGNALELLGEARRIAVSSDNPSLRIRTNLSLGNVLFYQGRAREAFRLWLATLTEAEQEESVELAAVCRIHIDRGRLFRAAAAGNAAILPEDRPGRPDGENGGAEAGTAAEAEAEAAGAAERGRRNRRRQQFSPGNVSVAQSVRDSVIGEMAVIKDRQYTALAWTVAALAERELGNYAEAEAAVRRALSIHEKDRYLEQAAYDWYLVASIRSTGGMYPAAEAAVTEAIAFDRRAENSWGLAADWRALGDIRKKAGDAAGAAAAYGRSAEIFRSLGMETEATAVEGRGKE
jgi:tetratricopeptide (TPR) repeat protein